MSIGSRIRTLLGPRAARIVGGAYRAIFVDLVAVARVVSAEIPTGAHVLDIGGGDGALVNLVLDLRPDITVTTLDVAPTVGQWIDRRHAHRVVRVPSTPLDAYLASRPRAAQAILLTDVLHHVPVEARGVLIRTLLSMLDASPSLRIIVKDVEPGHWRARLGYLSDRYITGDRDVRLVSRAQLVEAMRGAAADIRWTETRLFSLDKPNYAVVFWR